MSSILRIIVIGGGAAGYFGAIRAASCNPEAQVTILERGHEVLGKVRISGGGRCNLTHACFEARELVKNYPRGSRELLGPFNRFACGDTLDWFGKRGVDTKIEDDGRIFPTSDDSATIVDCLQQAARQAGVKVLTSRRITGLVPPEAAGMPWRVLGPEQEWLADRLLIASGSNPAVWSMLAGLGHSIVPPVPSLFTFNCKDERLSELAGVSVPLAEVSIVGSRLEAAGPLLVTHWGLSGPGILKLSAWGARELAAQQYRFTLVVNWVAMPLEHILEEIQQLKTDAARRQLGAHAAFDLPSRLWKRLVDHSGVPSTLQWAQLSKAQMQQLAEALGAARFNIQGKSTFKDEFVTAGGVDLREVNFKTFGSKIHPQLFFAGEVLDIDAITGGFNFQAAWTGGWIAGEAMVSG